MQDEYGRSNCWKEGLPEWLEKKVKLANYIWNSKDALASDTGEIL